MSRMRSGAGRCSPPLPAGSDPGSGAPPESRSPRRFSSREAILRQRYSESRKTSPVAVAAAVPPSLQATCVSRSPPPPEEDGDRSSMVTFRGTMKRLSWFSSLCCPSWPPFRPTQYSASEFHSTVWYLQQIGKGWPLDTPNSITDGRPAAKFVEKMLNRTETPVFF